MADGGGGGIVRQAPARRGRRPSYSVQKIEMGIAEDIRLSGITEPTFFALTPAERRKRIEKRLTDKGLEKDELPKARAFRRYWQKRARTVTVAA